MPSLECRVITWSASSWPRMRTMVCAVWVLKAPTICRVTPAGLHSGPRMLKKVRTPRDLRTGITCFIAGWKWGAKRNAMPASCRQCSTPSLPSSISTPSVSSTSADPDLEETDRLPCLATVAPAPAATREAVVEMLKVLAPSPPVPQRSMACGSSHSTSMAKSRIVLVKPTSSSRVSSRVRRPMRNAAMCSSLAFPLIICCMASAACERVSGSPSAMISRNSFTGGNVGCEREEMIVGYAAAGRGVSFQTRSSQFLMIWGPARVMTLSG